MAITNASRLADFGSGIGTAGAVIQIDNANQRVGIGTNNPLTTLQVAGIVSATSFTGNLTGNVSGNVNGYINSPGISTIVNLQSTTLNVTGVSTVANGQITNLNVSGVTTTTTLNVGTGGTIITTTSGGLVGIGTTNPTSTLTVNGNANISGVVTASSFVASNGFQGTITAGIAQTSGAGISTSIDFAGIPSWAKRVTVMFNGVSTNGSSTLLIQLGSGSFVGTGYTSIVTSSSAAPATTTSVFGLILANLVNASSIFYGKIDVVSISSNNYISSGILYNTLNSSSVPSTNVSAGKISLSGTIDRIRITTSAGSDTFDAGEINILYEG